MKPTRKNFWILVAAVNAAAIMLVYWLYPLIGENGSDEPMYVVDQDGVRWELVRGRTVIAIQREDGLEVLWEGPDDEVPEEFGDGVMNAIEVKEGGDNE